MVLFSACRKQMHNYTEPCLVQTANPDKATYSSSEFTRIDYNNKHCGLLPLSKKHKWIYLDSIFEVGVFARVKTDTLQFSTTWQTQADGLIWWQPTKNVGLPELCFSNDSAIISLQVRLFSSPRVMDARKEIFISAIDSIRFLSSFVDEAAIATEKMNKTISTSLGHFTDCIFLEKFSPGYRKDQVYLKPGVGVVKYYYMEADGTTPGIPLQRISTLVKYIFE